MVCGPFGILFQSCGNLENGDNAGLWYVNGRNRLGNTWWNIGSRASEQMESTAIDTDHGLPGFCCGGPGMPCPRG